MRARLYIDDTRQRIRQGHPWIFDNQILRFEGQPEAGGIVQVFDVKKGPLGQAYFNPRSPEAQMRARQVFFYLRREPERTPL